MTEDSQENSALNTLASLKLYHAQLHDISYYTPVKLAHLQRGGIRTGASRTLVETQQMLDRIPASQRFGIDGYSAANKVKEYLADKDASHIKPHSKGGSIHPSNIKWEYKTFNRVRGSREMTTQEQIYLDMTSQVDNLTGALKAGLQSMPKGVLVGAIATAPFSALRNSLRVTRGEISSTHAAIETVKETAIGGGVGAISAFTATSFAAVFPPIAVALTAISPVLIVAGGAGMVYNVFQILDEHNQKKNTKYRLLEYQIKEILNKDLRIVKIEKANQERIDFWKSRGIDVK
jgi:hypothetical protein